MTMMTTKMMDELTLSGPEDVQAEAPSEAVAVSDLEPSQEGKTEVSKDVAIDLAAIARMIPDKMAFKIGEVADITNLKTYVLRYWETEFDALNPQKSAFNQRVYSRRDVETVLLIKKLLYEEKFSIAGAKKKIKELRTQLKAEKQIIETNDRVERALSKLDDLIADIGSLRELFN